MTRRLGEQKPKAYLALGRIAHDSLLTALEEKLEQIMAEK